MYVYGSEHNSREDNAAIPDVPKNMILIAASAFAYCFLNNGIFDEDPRKTNLKMANGIIAAVLAAINPIRDCIGKSF